MNRFQYEWGAALLLWASKASAWEGQVIVSTDEWRQDYYGALKSDN